MIISASIHCTCTYTVHVRQKLSCKQYYLSIGLWIDSDRPSKVSCSADGLVQGFTRAVSQVRDCCNKFAYPCMQRDGIVSTPMFISCETLPQ